MTTSNPTSELGSLVGEAAKKSSLLWLAPDVETAAYPLWFVWEDGVAYVVFGGSEQPAPGLAQLSQAVVHLRSKDKGGLLVSWQAIVTQVAPDSTGWPAAATALLAKRLNATDGDAAAARWETECQIARLTPVAVLASPGSMSADPGDAPPRSTPATSRVPVPYTLRFRGLRNPRRGLG